MLSTLPVELVSNIIAFALPPYIPKGDGSPSHERYFILTRLVLVSKAFHALATVELYRHVYLPHVSDWTPFRKVVERSRTLDSRRWHTRPFYASIESLQLDGGVFVDLVDCDYWQTRAMQSIGLLPNLRELWLQNLRFVNLEDLSMASASLTTLHIDGCVFAPTTQDVYLPRVTSLFINGNLPSAAFSSASCPNLRSIALCWEPCVKDSTSPWSNFPVQISLLRCLTSVIIGRHNNGLAAQIAIFLSRCHALRHLSVNNSNRLLLYVRAVHHPFDTLDLGHHHDSELSYLHENAHVHDLLDENLLATSQLQTLSMSKVFNHSWTGRRVDRHAVHNPDMMNLLRQREETRGMCIARGIELVEKRVTEDGEDEHCAWTDCTAPRRKRG